MHPRPTPFHRPNEHNDQSRLARLPAELLVAIAGQLTPTERLFLSRTCGRVHAVIRNTPTFRGDAACIAALPAADRIDILATVVREQVDQFLCETCIALHSVMFLDADHWKRTFYFIQPESFFPSLLLPQRHNDLDGWKKFPKPVMIRYRRVQLALKYARMAKDNPWWSPSALRWSHRYYQRRLLLPKYMYVYLYLLRPTAFGMSGVQARISFYPKIVWVPAEPGERAGGKHRFLVLALHHRLGNLADLKPSSPHTPRRHYVCPHQYFCYGVDDRANIDGHRNVSCPQCPTDIVWHNGACYVYKDLGAECSPTDPAWLSQLWGRSRFQTVPARPRFGNPEPERHVVYHAPGSIEALYNA